MSASARLSICMIVRDEAPRIARCLSSVQGVADEVCIVDTGSSDDTISIAREMGATVQTFEWEDDFAAARNASLQMANGKWIFVIDADEELTPDSLGPLAEATLRPDAAFLVHQDNLRDDGSTQTLLVPRLFQNRDDVRFSRPIHESIMADIERIGASALTPVAVRLRHDGYLRETLNRIDKAGRNLALLRRQVLRAPDDIYSHYKVAATLTKRDQSEERGRHLDHAASLVEASSAAETKRLPFIPALISAASRHESDTGNLQRAKELVQLVSGEHPHSAEMQYASAEIHRRTGSATMAVDAYKATLALPKRATLHPERSGVHDVLPLIGLSRVLSMHGDPKKAHELCAVARRHSQKRVDVRCEWIRRAMAAGDMTGAWETLRELVDEAPRDPATSLLRGDIAWSQGDSADATRHWRTAAPGSAIGYGETESQAIARVAIAACCNGDHALALRELGRLRDVNVSIAACRHALSAKIGAEAGPSPGIAQQDLEAHQMSWQREIERGLAALTA